MHSHVQNNPTFLSICCSVQKAASCVRKLQIHIEKILLKTAYIECCCSLNSCDQNNKIAAWLKKVSKAQNPYNSFYFQTHKMHVILQIKTFKFVTVYFPETEEKGILGPIVHFSENLSEMGCSWHCSEEQRTWWKSWLQIKKYRK